MRISEEQLNSVRQFGLHVTERCDACGRLLNQAFRYMRPGHTEVWCSEACQDKAMGWNRAQRKSRDRPAFRLKVCQRTGCAKKFRATRQDARFCSARCRQWDRRKRGKFKSVDIQKIGGENPVVTDNQFSPSPDPHKQRVEMGSESLTGA